MLSRQYVIRTLIDRYIDTRKQLYEDCEDTLQEHCIKLLAKKHTLVNAINNLLDDTEREVILKDFNAITQYKIDGCSMEDMKGYMVDRERSTYFECLEHRKAAIRKTFDDNLGLGMPSIKLPSDSFPSEGNLLEQYKVKGSITSLRKKDEITTAQSL